MNISLTGNPKVMTLPSGAAETLPAARDAGARGPEPHRDRDSGAAGTGWHSPPAEPEKAVMRDDMTPDERELEMRKESLKREAQKADERRAEEAAAKQLRAQLMGGLLPGERGLVKDELDRIVIRA